MNAPVTARGRSLRSLALAVSSALSVFAAQPPVVSSEPVVELPPMIVIELSTAPPWLYVAAGDTEFLSRCSSSATRAFVTTQLEIHRLLRAWVPAEFLAPHAVPNVSVLVPISSMPARDDAVFREMLGLERSPASGRYEFLPNQRLDDRDMMAVFTFLDEGGFDARRMIVATDYVHALLSRRTPMLPQWLIEGVVGLYVQSKARDDGITLEPARWISRDDALGLQRDPEARRVLLSCDDLFAPDALLGPGRQHFVRGAAWRAQTALFVRWALDPANAPARDALWKFAVRVSHEPMTEAVFVECFGFGFSDLRDRLSDYLPVAVKDAVRLPVGKLAPLPPVEIKPATLAQIARLRGEWERLEIPLVRDKHPRFLAHYVDQARKTFQRATSRGEREPQLLAALGLCELDAGDAAAARPLLEQASAAHVVRPRVYFEVARLRWEELTRGVPATQRFTRAQIHPVLEPLRRALDQSPALPEVFLLALEVSLRCPERTPPEELARLAAGAGLFRRIPMIGLRVALLQTRQGQRAEAAAGLAQGLEFVTNPDMRSRYAQLQAALAGPRTAP